MPRLIVDETYVEKMLRGAIKARDQKIAKLAAAHQNLAKGLNDQLMIILNQVAAIKASTNCSDADLCVITQAAEACCRLPQPR
jgi:hypothetical protein